MKLKVSLAMKVSTSLGGDRMEKDLSIVFNASKNEKFKVNDNYRTFQRRTKASYSNLIVNKEAITPELLQGVGLFICSGKWTRFSNFFYSINYPR